MGRGCVLGGWLAKIDYWGSRLLITFVYFRNFLLVELQICVDWQRYWKQFNEDIRNVRIRFEFLFRCLFVSEERDHWKEPSKYESPNMEWKDKMQSRAEGFFLKSRPLGKKKSRRDKVAKSKRPRIGVDSFVDSFASKALALWLYLPPQLRGSWFSSDQRSKSRNCRHNGNTQFLLNFVEQNPLMSHIVFTAHTKCQPTQLGTPFCGHSRSVKQSAISNRAIFQHRQLNW